MCYFNAITSGLFRLGDGPAESTVALCSFMRSAIARVGADLYFRLHGHSRIGEILGPQVAAFALP